MLTTEQLFANQQAWGRLHDVLAELSDTDRTFSRDEVRAAWDRLPEDIRDIAHTWGIGDTVFGDEAYEWLRDNPLP